MQTSGNVSKNLLNGNLNITHIKQVTTEQTLTLFNSRKGHWKVINLLHIAGLHNAIRYVCRKQESMTARSALYKWIEWVAAEIWPFEIIQDGGLPLTWIWCNRK